MATLNLYRIHVVHDAANPEGRLEEVAGSRIDNVDAVSITAPERSLETEAARFEIGNMTVEARGLPADYFADADDPLNAPFIAELYDDLGNFTFWGVVEQARYNRASRVTSFIALSPEFILKRAPKLAPRKVWKGEALTWYLTEDGGRAKLVVPTETDASIGDVVVMDLPGGEWRAPIWKVTPHSESGWKVIDIPYDSEMASVVTDDGAEVFSGLFGMRVLRFSEEATQDILAFFADEITQESGDLDTISLQGRGFVVEFDTGVTFPIFQIAVWNTGSQAGRAQTYIASSPAVGDFDTVTLLQASAHGGGDETGGVSFEIMGREMFGYAPPIGDDQYDILTLIEAIAVLGYGNDGTGLTDGETPDEGRPLGILPWLVTDVTLRGDSQIGTIWIGAELSDNPLEALRELQLTGRSFVRFEPTKVNGLPRVDIEIIPRDVLAVEEPIPEAIAGVIEWEEDEAPKRLEAVVVKPNESYFKPESEGEVVGFWYVTADGRMPMPLPWPFGDIPVLTAEERRYRSIPTGNGVLEMDLPLVPSYRGALFGGGKVLNDALLAYVARYYYEWFKITARRVSGTIFQRRDDILGKVVSVQEGEGDNYFEQTVIVTKASIDVGGGRTRFEGLILPEYTPPVVGPPVVIISGSRVYEANATAQEAEVLLNSFLSYSPAGHALEYSWRVGGTEVGTGSIFEYVLAVGTWPVTLRVTDTVTGLWAEETVTISVTGNAFGVLGTPTVVHEIYRPTDEPREVRIYTGDPSHMPWVRDVFYAVVPFEGDNTIIPDSSLDEQAELVLDGTNSHFRIQVPDSPEHLMVRYRVRWMSPEYPTVYAQVEVRDIPEVSFDDLPPDPFSYRAVPWVTRDGDGVQKAAVRLYFTNNNRVTAVRYARFDTGTGLSTEDDYPLTAVYSPLTNSWALDGVYDDKSKYFAWEIEYDDDTIRRASMTVNVEPPYVWTREFFTASRVVSVNGEDRGQALLYPVIPEEIDGPLSGVTFESGREGFQTFEPEGGGGALPNTAAWDSGLGAFLLTDPEELEVGSYIRWRARWDDNTITYGMVYIANVTRTSETLDSKLEEDDVNLFARTGNAIQETDVPTLPQTKIAGSGSDADLSVTLGKKLEEDDVNLFALAGNPILATDVPSLNASKINAGTFNVDRIPSLNASKINAGSFHVDRIPTLDASKIGSGTFGTERIGQNAITAYQIDGDAIEEYHLNDYIITLDKVADGAISNAKIANNTITDAKINSSTRISLSKIQGAQVVPSGRDASLLFTLENRALFVDDLGHASRDIEFNGHKLISGDGSVVIDEEGITLTPLVDTIAGSVIPESSIKWLHPLYPNNPIYVQGEIIGSGPNYATYVRFSGDGASAVNVFIDGGIYAGGGGQFPTITVSGNAAIFGNITQVTNLTMSGLLTAGSARVTGNVRAASLSTHNDSHIVNTRTFSQLAHGVYLDGDFQPLGYRSSDGSAGITKTIVIGTHTLTVKNGILTAHSESGLGKD